MQKIYLIIVIIVSAGCSRFSSLEKEKELQSLLDKKEYFKLRTRLLHESDEISAEKKIYFRAYLRNAFNENQKSAEDVDALLTQYASTLPDSMKSGLMQIQIDNYFKTFQYSKAAFADSELIKKYQSSLDSERIADIKNDLIAHKALHSIPAQDVTIRNADTLS